MASIDILIPTYSRPAALAVTLMALCAQTRRDFNVIISDQTEEHDAIAVGEVQAVLRVLRLHGHQVTTHRHLPRRGLAEHRQFLLDQSTAPYVLFMDDDWILEADVVDRLWNAMQQEQCGFVGCANIGLSFANDVRPHQQAIEFWETPVQPEIVRSGTPAWERYKLHNAANVLHVQQNLGLAAGEIRKYKVAWVAGAILFDAAKLRDVGGFGFWEALPMNHCGEDVLAQLRVMAKYGGCGVLPSGVYHQELPTTVIDRRLDAPQLLPL
ncbi:glycosyltransferase [Microcoleus sp. FACHB-1515]|uniref:glycosyltransferase family 2 protein n=1 Tax=Cyanophyceae TaxID=3028117 RepID=UPI001683BE37|nr:glycosyltransferase family 2 protein [Microcoleus sp. FACHB-1515]MBD2091729.1 glycosyltransferase [Microcoleus sp. FACHB-1515]